MPAWRTHRDAIERAPPCFRRRAFVGPLQGAERPCLFSHPQRRKRWAVVRELCSATTAAAATPRRPPPCAFSLRQMNPTGIRRNEAQLPKRRLSTLRLPWWGKSEAFPVASAGSSLVDRVSKRRGERCHERIRCFDHVLSLWELRRTDISDELLERGDALVLHLLLHLVEIAVLL